MKKGIKKFYVALIVFVMLFMVTPTAFAVASSETTETIGAIVSNDETAADVTRENDGALGDKAMGAAIAVGLAAGAGAIGMGIAIAKAVEGVSRQPEAEGKIRTTLMLGLVFVETAIIYALVVAILLIFVL